MAERFAVHHPRLRWECQQGSDDPVFRRYTRTLSKVSVACCSANGPNCRRGFGDEAPLWLFCLFPSEIPCALRKCPYVITMAMIAFGAMVRWSAASVRLDFLTGHDEVHHDEVHQTSVDDGGSAIY